MRSIQTVCLSVLLAVAMAGSAAAQATVNTTTLSAAVAATGNTVTLTSAATVAVGQFIFVDRELMAVTAIAGTSLTVARGVGGTAAQAHAAGVTTYTAPANFYAGFDVNGPCTAGNELALPRIVPITGNIFTCVGGRWQLIAGGRPDVRRGIVTIVGSSIAAGTCSSAVLSAPGLTTSATVTASVVGAPSGVLSSGGLILTTYATANNANLVLCNPTAGALVPGATSWSVTAVQ